MLDGSRYLPKIFFGNCTKNIAIVDVTWLYYCEWLRKDQVILVIVKQIKAGGKFCMTYYSDGPNGQIFAGRFYMTNALPKVKMS